MSISFDICHHSQYHTSFIIYLCIQFLIVQGFLTMDCSLLYMSLVLVIIVSQMSSCLVSNTHHRHSLECLLIILHFPYSSCIVLSSIQMSMIQARLKLMARAVLNALQDLIHSNGTQNNVKAVWIMQYDWEVLK